jgi:FkbH-like protein
MEAIRLVVWDLDETFWRGTVTEGGIVEYVQEHQEIVIELSRRGILNSICSKNDHDTIRSILMERNIWQYFIFPSISWESKGPRIQSLIEATQLRPATVLFIDDNPGNRGEALDFVPDLQVADEKFIPQILLDPRFVGKRDPEMSRLKQYKLLEERKRDQLAHATDNSEFLRRCNIRLRVEYDVEANLDRAVELIARTNQLNFTKKRLPEDIGEAKKSLLALLKRAGVQSGLIQVVDRYGDYGYVGIFIVEGGRRDGITDHAMQTLVHFCFSCRTLGMQIEYWVYEWLRRPSLNVVGEVLTDLFSPKTVDWVRLVTSIASENESEDRVASEIRVHGGCEANAIAHYLAAASEKVVVSGNFATSEGWFARLNGISLLLSAVDSESSDFDAEMARLKLPSNLMKSGLFNEANGSVVLVVSVALDSHRTSPRYRHKANGWIIRTEINGLTMTNLVKTDAHALRQEIESSHHNTEAKAAFLPIVDHLRANYESVDGPDDIEFQCLCMSLTERMVQGAKLVVLLDAERYRHADQKVKPAPWMTRFNNMVRRVFEDIPFVAIVGFDSFISDEEEIQMGGNHYDRMVYFRVAEEIVKKVRNMPAKTSEEVTMPAGSYALS